MANNANTFGTVTDYFGLASSSLVPISSESGDNRQRECVAHYGKWESDVSEISGTWRNPSVTYVVKADCTFRCTLGNAFAGTSTVSGYMITEATVETSVGNFPTVTVRGVANEGANAINTFSVSIPIVARSKAQNLLNAVSGGGQLQSCTISATCEPVVVSEDMMPCASDVVKGRLTATVTTIDTTGVGAPTAAGGFAALGAPVRGVESSYTTYQMIAEKEL